jgi:hypothetical protein
MNFESWNNSKEKIEAMKKLQDEFLEKAFDKFGMSKSGSNDIYKTKTMSIGEVRDELYQIFKKLSKQELRNTFNKLCKEIDGKEDES